MHYTGTGKIVKAQAIQETATPLPVALDRVDETSHYHGKSQEAPQLHTLSHRARYDRHGSGDKHHLKEKV